MSTPSVAGINGHPVRLTDGVAADWPAIDHRGTNLHRLLAWQVKRDRCNDGWLQHPAVDFSYLDILAF